MLRKACDRKFVKVSSQCVFYVLLRFPLDPLLRPDPDLIPRDAQCYAPLLHWPARGLPHGSACEPLGIQIFRRSAAGAPQRPKGRPAAALEPKERDAGETGLACISLFQLQSRRRTPFCLLRHARCAWMKNLDSQGIRCATVR